MGKTEFARYLAREHGFAQYDLECHPTGWPHPELKQTWDDDPANSMTQVRKDHERIALDWGFPVSCLPKVKDLQTQGVQLIWFEGDVARSRDAFVQRALQQVGSQLEAIRRAWQFDSQVEAIKNAGYPASLNCLVVPALSASGVFLGQPEIEHMVFP